MIEFLQVSGNASGEDGTPAVGPATVRRTVTLVLDDSNWIIERALAKRANKATRARIQQIGECRPFVLEPGEELFVFARLSSGGAGTQWDLSVTVTTDGA